jgi:hypothetical protein
LSEKKFNDLEFSESLFYSSRIDREKTDKIKFENRLVALNRYLAGDGGRGSFNTYLKSLGLDDQKKRLTKKQKEMLVNKSHIVGNTVAEMFKRNRKL